MKRAVYFLLALAITVAALAYALHGVEFGRVLTLLRGGRYWVIGPYLLLLAGFFWLNALRWVLILSPLGRFRWTEVTPSMMIGFAANNLLPARAGELVRAVLFARQFRQPVTGSLVSLALERMLDMGAILVYYALAIAFIGRTPEGIQSVVLVIAVLLGTAGAAVAGVLLWPAAVEALWQTMARGFPATVAQRGNALLRQGIQALHAVRSPRVLGLLVFLSLLRWAAALGMIFLSIAAYDVLPPLAVVMLVLAVTSFAVSLPGTPGFVGTIQAAFVFVLVPFGIGAEVALAASIFFLVGNWVPVTAAGILLWLYSGIQVATLRRELDEARQEDVLA
jgi:hypothetical protein